MHNKFLEIIHVTNISIFLYNLIIMIVVIQINKYSFFFILLYYINTIALQNYLYNIFCMLEILISFEIMYTHA